ncbi:porin [Vibrio breoganii]|uniref:carbohydrate porin n=1 Tax=Vibrio breoganii TaxID=553239 RepID=UPI000C8545F1|nr:carbohydrate porin [Vibrio breoganii]PMG93536.1 porin [Vibrio breoganii]PML79123.1 porin [Vibrio breoganii]PMM41303.1 porin [Vibrio breoganii]PMM84937.1 porin [Vibrio breoganii]PMO91118.1 porin [Vibrio breoganii]
MTLTSRLSKSCLAIVTVLASASAFAEGGNFEGPDSVENTIAAQKGEQKHWRENLADKGFTFGADYFALGLASPNGATGDDVSASSGVARLYGQWNLVGRDSGNTGSLIWKIEHRHAYSDYAPKDFSGITGSPFNPDTLGYMGLMSPAFSDQGFRVTDLNWKQKINGGRGTIQIGWQDVTNYVDTYALASPWTGFSNLAFSTGSGVMGLPDDGILALSGGHMIGDNFYVVAGIADANGDSGDIFEGFNTVGDGEYFKTLEFGWTASQDQIFTENFHITLWQMDGGTRHNIDADGDDGQGINFSYSTFVTPQIMPFVRGGFSEGGVALYDKSISAGFGYFALGGANNNLGFALNWSEINDEYFLAPLANSDSQVTAELYYNMQFGDHFQVTPDIQLIVDPAFSTEDTALVVGVRGRVFF